MGIRRSFLALAMARVASCARHTNATVTATSSLFSENLSNVPEPRLLRRWPESYRQLDGTVRRPPPATSSSPSPSPTPSLSQSIGHSRHCSSGGSWGRIGIRRRCQHQLLFTGGLFIPRVVHERWAFESIRPARGGCSHVLGASASRGVVTMAQPRKKLPQRSVDVFCQKCGTQLYKYKKGGKGSLVKCYKERIVEDFTDGKLECPNCGQLFARDTMVHGKPAFKMIGGKVYQKK